MPHFSTKTYSHDLGISCAFRQWRAEHSHCQYLHGYALSFKFIFGCDHLDDKNWVQDFGGLKLLKERLMESFDHKTVVAEDDPLLGKFHELEQLGMLQLTVLPSVGCEKFAEYAYDLASKTIAELDSNMLGRVWVVNCEVAEHGSNSAIYVPFE
jgi:6-pyruvoyltetrahydropterin/6-carboxytetrahydropterin synthase